MVTNQANGGKGSFVTFFVGIDTIADIGHISD